jgi:hypothetical protein
VPEDALQSHFRFGAIGRLSISYVPDDIGIRKQGREIVQIVRTNHAQQQPFSFDSWH